jgi:hypothetical protein
MKKHTRNEILQALREVAQKLGPSFKATEFEELTGIDYHAVSRAFGSWHDAMIAAKLEPITSKRNITKPDLIEQAKLLTAELGKNTLTISEWRKKGICDDGVIRRRFGSWSNFLKDAGLKVGNPQDTANDELLAEMGRLHNLLGKKVSPTDMDFQGKFSSSTYIRRWGSWKNAWVCYIDSSYVMPIHKPQEIYEVQQSGKQYFGDIIDLPGLLRAPVNELGVIYLFALVSKRLGYSIEGIQADFPDAIAKRKLPGQKHWESIRIEFEYESSSFKKHGHDPKGCDLIICWEHNWKECPLPVLELQKAIKGLGK